MNDNILLLGVDGGGSKTVALLANGAGEELGRGVAGTANHFTVGKERAFAALEEAITASFADAGKIRSPLAALCLGLAGVDRPDNQALFAPWIAEQFSQTPSAMVRLVNDAELVLAAGTPDGWGIAVICGTGVLVMGKNRQGERRRVDGWGYLLGDQGSGFSIGLAALQAVLAAHDGRGDPTSLRDLILHHCNLTVPTDLLGWVYRDRVPTAEIALLSRLVDAAADQGDSVAQKILKDAGRQLAHSVQTLAKQLGFQGAIPCALAGGVMSGGEISGKIGDKRIYHAFHEAIMAQGIVLQPVNDVFEPAIGAVRLAQRLLEE